MAGMLKWSDQEFKTAMTDIPRTLMDKLERVEE